jgi:peroxiredoxin Q/BCP
MPSRLRVPWNVNGGSGYSRSDGAHQLLDTAVGWIRVAGMLQEGINAPQFEIPDQNGNPVSLRDLAGHWVLLWWYPKASTRG